MSSQSATVAHLSTSSYESSLASQSSSPPVAVDHSIDSTHHANVDDDNHDAASSSSPFEVLPAPIIVKNAAEATAAKVAGNELFARQQYPGAIIEYSRAIDLCPYTIDDVDADDIVDADAAAVALAALEISQAASAAAALAASTPATLEEVTDEDEAADAIKSSATSSTSTSSSTSSASTSTPPSSESIAAAAAIAATAATRASDRAALGIYYSNRSACYLLQSSYSSAVLDCSTSLRLTPRALKPLGRRAKAHEALGQLAECVDDLKQIVAIDPRDRDAAASLVRVTAALDAKNEAMKAEMMGKLKDFGNTILGKFGMSLDNFKAKQDPATGSYNISFGK